MQGIKYCKLYSSVNEYIVVVVVVSMGVSKIIGKWKTPRMTPADGGLGGGEGIPRNSCSKSTTKFSESLPCFGPKRAILLSRSQLVLSKPILVFSPADLGKRFFLSLSEQKCETSSASKHSEKQAMKACTISGAACKSVKSAPFQCFWRITEN